MKHFLLPHHLKHCRDIGIPVPPLVVDMSNEEYFEHYNAWKRTLPHAGHEEWHKRALANRAWRDHALKPEEKKLLAWERLIIMVLLALLFMLVFFGRAHAQFSHVSYVNWQQGGSNIAGAFFTFPFNVNCSTNLTCSASGNTLTMTASSSAATAWSGITAATNSNVGTFLASGNSWDFTAATIFKQRVSAGLTSSANGDLGYDTTNKNWHVWGNAVDNLMGIIPASVSVTNGHLATWSLSGGVLTLNDGGAVPSGGSPCTTTALSIQYDNAGAFGCVAQFTYSGSTLTGASGTMDLTGMTLVKQRVSAGLTASVNGDIGQDSTTGYWHGWQNGHDRLMAYSTNVGTAGQVFESNADGTGTYADPIVSYNYVNLWTAQDITVTRTSSTVRVSTFGQFGELIATFAGITGSPSGCTIQIKSADSAGNLTTNGSAVSITAANGTSAILFTPVINTASQMDAVWACSTYPTAGTLTLDFVPSITTYSVLSDGTQIIGTSTHPVRTDPTGTTTQPVSAASLPLPTGAAVSASQCGGANSTAPCEVSATTAVNSVTNPIFDKLTDGTNPLGTASNPMRTDPTGTTTQPVSAASLPLPSGASISADQCGWQVANPCGIAGLGSGATGGTLVGPSVGDTYKAINISTATTTLIVTGVSGRQVRISAQHMIAAAADNVAWIEGTGATCGTGTAGMAGGTTAASGYNFAANGGIAEGSGLGTVLQTVTTGDSVCLVTSAAVQLSGGVEYTIY